MWCCLYRKNKDTINENKNIEEEDEKKEKTEDFISFCNRDDVKSMPRSTFAGYKCWGYVTDIYDGDTVTIAFKYGGTVLKHPFRLLGFDAPEIKPLTTIQFRSMHIQAAHVARDKLKELLATYKNFVVVLFDKNEKYGRTMGTLWTGHIPTHEKDSFDAATININEWCVEHGFGIAYDGGTKKDFTETQLRQIIIGT
jgi:endonuclease YncB( thermonuclease family)